MAKKKSSVKLWVAGARLRTLIATGARYPARLWIGLGALAPDMGL